MARRPILVLLVLAASFGWVASAQEIRIGVVVDRSGPAASPAMDAVLDAFASRALREGGVFGTPLRLVVRDGRSEPARVRAAVDALAREENVHAVVCCTSVAEVRAATEAAGAHGVLLLTIAPASGGPPGWSYGLGPGERTALRAVVSHAYAEGKRALALMTLSNGFGDLPQRVLEVELPVAGMALAAVERYRPDASVLTPEALWVATRQPGAVVVWGLPRDTAVAVDALRRRGYEGPVYARGALIEGAAADAPLEGVRYPVAPIVADAAPPADGSAWDAAASLADMLFALYGIRDVDADAARTHDALSLLHDAAEQAALYGVTPDDVPGYRVALRDAAIALPPYAGAGGTYDLGGDSDAAALPHGLTVIEVRDGRRIPVEP